jgi:phage tail-like protein
MARASKSDPIRNFKFRVSIEPSMGLSGTSHLNTLLNTGDRKISDLGFSVVSGVSVSNEMITYREGGMNTHMHKMPGQSDFGPITLSKGMLSGESDLYMWQQFLHSWAGGGPGKLGSTTEDNDFRCDVLVKVFDHPVTVASYYDPDASETKESENLGSVRFGFKIYNAWPASYSFTDLNAGDSSIMIQQLVLNHEGFHAAYTSDEVDAL